MKRCQRVLLASAALWFCTPAIPAEPPPLALEAKVGLGTVRGRIDHLAVDLQRRRVFVAELGNDSVGVVDAKENRLLRRIEGLKEPQGVGYAAPSDMLYVANASDGSVRLFGGDQYAPSGSIDLHDDADNIRVDTRSGQVVVGYGRGALALLDAAKAGVVATIPLPAHPEGFQIDESGRQVFVNLPGSHQIGVVDRDAGKLTATLPTNGGNANFPMAIDRATGRLFVVFRSPTRLAVYSIRDAKEQARIDTCGDSDDVFFDARRQRIYVSCGEGFVDVFSADGSRMSRLARIGTVSGARTAFFVPEWDRYYLAVRASGGTPAALWVYKPGS